MRIRGWFTCVLACALLLTPLASAQAEPLENDVRDQTPHQRVVGLCFQRTVLFGRIIVADGCYEPYLIRTGIGGFLALATPGGAIIAPGQVVALTTPAGQQVWGRVQYLVPLQIQLAAMPVSTLQVATVRVDGRRLIVPIPGSPVQPIEVEFRQR